MDLSKFFDRVQHDILMVRVARKVHDRQLLKLIGRCLRAGVMVERELQPSIDGTMQGGPLSPILANILLDDFDKELESRGSTSCVTLTTSLYSPKQAKPPSESPNRLKAISRESSS
jgi:retron-type reverse transcriptase